MTLTLAPSMRVNMGSLAINADHGFTVADTGTGVGPTLSIGALSGTESRDSIALAIAGPTWSLRVRSPGRISSLPLL